MRECICQTPTVCRDLSIQWSRLGEGRYVDYILLPPLLPTTTTRIIVPHAETTLSSTVDGGTARDTTKEPTTKGGKHGFAFRNIVYRGLGYDNYGVGHGGVDNANGGEEGGSDTAVTAVTVNEGAVMTNNTPNNIQNNNDNNNKSTTSSKKNNEYIAMVHFDPRIFPHLRRDGMDPPWSSTVCKRKKVDKWRIPLDVGREIGYTDDYLCPDTDSMGTMTYFAVPNYNLNVAAATLKLAVTTCKDTLRQLRNEDTALLAAAEAAAVATATANTTNSNDELGAKRNLVKDDNPKKMVARMQHINQTNATLKKENIDLCSRLLQNDTIRNTLQIRSISLTRVHDRLSQRVERLEKIVKQNAKKRAREKARDDEFLGKIGVGDDNVMTTTTSTKTKRAKSTSTTKEGNAVISTTNTTGNETKQSSGSGDKRVEAKFYDPSLLAEEALHIGGFVFSTTTAVPPPGMPFYTDGGGSGETGNGDNMGCTNGPVPQGCYKNHIGKYHQ